MKTIFLGNETSYLDTLRDCTGLQCVVGQRVSAETRRYFGSSFDYAGRHGIRTLSPKQYLASPPPADLVVSAGFGRLIPPHVIAAPTIGIINIHHSLLPAYRGRHPLNWALIHGERQTGVTIHHVNERFDEGNIIAQHPVPIDRNDTIMDVFYKTVSAGDALLRRVLSEVGTPMFEGRSQDPSKASYYPPRKPADGLICWNDGAERIRNLVRALTEPYPGAFFLHHGQKTIVDEAELDAGDSPATPIGVPVGRGRHVRVQTGRGALLLTKLRGQAGARFRQHIQDHVCTGGRRPGEGVRDDQAE